MRTLKSQKLRTKGKKVLKNILTRPDDLPRPLVSDEQASQINSILKQDLPVMRDCKPRVPWYILMKITKEQRQTRIQQEIDSLPEETKQKIRLCSRARKFVGIGVNSCLRLMEGDQMMFCLIDSSVEPNLLVDKILALARHKQILTALVPSLSDTVSSSMGFRSFILGFKKSIEDTDCPIKGCTRIKQILDCGSIPSTFDSEMNEPKERMAELSNGQERFTDVYLYRSFPGQRVFHPQETPTKPESVADFIPISTDPQIKHNESFNRSRITSKKRPSKKFKSPIVVTLQSNQNKRRKR